MKKKIKLSLVGAGPGDPDLITLKAIKVLQKADVILYDALVNEALLDYAPQAVKMFVGKRLGCHACTQEQINQLIIESAFKYGHVVRLKGGDPFIFGRAKEEIDYATAFNIPVEVVQGVSSPLAVPASQMIPLTCRGISESFWVITGTKHTGELSTDLLLAAQSSATVVILMAMSKLSQIMDIFNNYGKANTPVAIIQNGTTKEEKYVLGYVHDIVQKSRQAGMSNPAVIVVGEVVSLHPDLMSSLYLVENNRYHGHKTP